MKHLSEQGKKEVRKAIMTAIYAGIADYGDGFDEKYFQEKTKNLKGTADEVGLFDETGQLLTALLEAKVEDYL